MLSAECHFAFGTLNSQPAAIYIDGLTGDEIRLIRSQEDGSPDYLLRLSKSLQQILILEVIIYRLIPPQAGGELGLYIGGTDSVHQYVFNSPFGSKDLSQRYDTRLAGTISNQFGKCDLSADRGNVDNLAAILFYHHPAHRLRTEKSAREIGSDNPVPGILAGILS